MATPALDQKCFSAAENYPSSWTDHLNEVEPPVLKKKSREQLEDEADPEHREFVDFLRSGMSPLERFAIEGHERLPDAIEAPLLLTINNLRSLLEAHTGGQPTTLQSLGNFSLIPQIRSELQPLSYHERTLVMQKAFGAHIATIVFLAGQQLTRERQKVIRSFPLMIRAISNKYLSVIEDSTIDGEK